MSKIVIEDKDFKLPKNCGDCDLTMWDQENGIQVCPFKIEGIDHFWNTKQRHPQCPLRELPDRDEFIKAVQEVINLGKFTRKDDIAKVMEVNKLTLEIFGPSPAEEKLDKYRFTKEHEKSYKGTIVAEDKK